MSSSWEVESAGIFLSLWLQAQLGLCLAAAEKEGDPRLSSGLWKEGSSCQHPACSGQASQGLVSPA